MRPMPISSGTRQGEGRPLIVLVTGAGDKALTRAKGSSATPATIINGVITMEGLEMGIKGKEEKVPCKIHSGLLFCEGIHTNKKIEILLGFLPSSQRIYMDH